MRLDDLIEELIKLRDGRYRAIPSTVVKMRVVMDREGSGQGQVADVVGEGHNIFIVGDNFE